MTLNGIQPSNNLNISKPTRTQVAIWSALVLVAVYVSLENYHAYQFGVHQDDSLYAVLARSLVFSDKYGLINVPGEPEPVKLPFGYPLLLVPFTLFAPDNFDALKFSSLIFTILNASILFFGWRFFVKTRSHWWGIAVVGLYVLAPMMIDHTRRVMSEPSFTTFCLLAVWLAERAAHGKQSWSFVMSVVLVFVVFTRTIGIVLVPIIFIYLLRDKGKDYWKVIARLVAQMAILLGLVIGATSVQPKDLLPSEYLKDENAAFLVAPFNAIFPTESGVDAPPGGEKSAVRVTDWGQTVEILVYELQMHFGNHIRRVALPFGGGDKEQTIADSAGIPTLPFIVGFFITALVFFGWWRLFSQEGLSLFLLFPTFYLGALFFWAWDDPRLLYPIQPQIQLGLLLSLEAVVLWVIPLVRRLNWVVASHKQIFGSLVVILVALNLYKSVTIDDSRLHVGDLELRSSWLKSSSNPSDVIMTEAPETDYLYSGRKTVSFPLLTTSDQLENYLVNKNIDYILLAPEIIWQSQPTYKPEYSAAATRILPLIAYLSAHDRIKLVYSSDRDLIQVYKTIP